MVDGKMNLGVVGCGDFLRWQLPGIRASAHLNVTGVYDPVEEKAGRAATQLGARRFSSYESLLSDAAIDMVALFVPPMVRLESVEKAVSAGKHIITTKPLASNVPEARKICEVVGSRVRVGVIYRRTGDRLMDTLKSIFEAETYGKLALLKMDWLHHYPQWNNWALDPEKNGGPFMDAMIHNLNISRYLMGRPIEESSLLSLNLAHPDLACCDTERMTVRFVENGVADLFITWAADLAVYGLEGNDREHMEQFFMVTDKGWLLKPDVVDDRPVIRVSRAGERQALPLLEESATFYDLYVEAVLRDTPNPATLPTLEEAREDIERITLPGPGGN